MTERGNLIVIEGADGVGKSRITAELIRQLSGRGLTYNAYAFPGNEHGTLGSVVYELHHNAAALGVREVAPVALQAAHIAAHLDAIERILRPQVNLGKSFVLDRYWWSTAVYGTVGGIAADVLESLIEAERHCWSELRPRVIFLIDCKKPWRASEDSELWRRLAQEYRNLAGRERRHSNVEVVNNSIDLNEIVRGIVETVVDHLGAKAVDNRISDAS